jgi:hypothetical protein
LATYSGRPIKWEGDGGAFLFHVTDGREFDESVLAAFRILDTLPSINGELQISAGLVQELAVRISIDAGQAVYDQKPGLTTGDFLNAFLKLERAVGRVGVVSITERIHRQLGHQLRLRFPGGEDSPELKVRIHRYGKHDAPVITGGSQSNPEPAVRREQSTSSLDQDAANRRALVVVLERLTPSDFASVLARIPRAFAQVS